MFHMMLKCIMEFNNVMWCYAVVLHAQFLSSSFLSLQEDETSK